MKVSIIIANYNYSKYLPYAVESVIAQSYKNIEIIIVDDGSKDNSPETILQLAQKYPGKIKAIFQENQGQGAAFNTGFEAISGDIVAFLDANATWKPNKLEQIVKVFNQSDVVGVMHLLDNIDSAGKVIPNSIMGKVMDDDLAKVIIDTGNAWCFPPTSGLAYRRSALTTVFPIDKAKWRSQVDGCLIYSTAFLGKIKTLSEVLGSYRLHSSNNFIQAKVELSMDGQMGVKMTNQYINAFLEKIGYKARVDLSRNLQYRRTNYYINRKWNFREALAISQLIMGWPFYNFLDRLYYLARFWLKNSQFLYKKIAYVKL
jgi:glycosyltransferase involved in cell wall biosynthesis